MTDGAYWRMTDDGSWIMVTTRSVALMYEMSMRHDPDINEASIGGLAEVAGTGGSVVVSVMLHRGEIFSGLLSLLATFPSLVLFLLPVLGEICVLGRF